MANIEKTARTNTERGTLTNIYNLLNDGLIQKPKEINAKVILNDTLDKYYKNFKLTDKAIKIIHSVEEITNKVNIIPTKTKKQIINIDCEEWIDEFRYLWTINNKPMKLNALGNRKICIEKMNEFCKNYPNYNKDLIINAAKKYIDDYTSQNGGDTTYLITAPYFIERKRNSPFNQNDSESISMKLEDYCELLLKENSDTNKNLPLYEQEELA